VHLIKQVVGLLKRFITGKEKRNPGPPEVVSEMEKEDREDGGRVRSFKERMKIKLVSIPLPSAFYLLA